MPPQEQSIQSSQQHRQPLLTSKNISIIVAGSVLIVALFRADPKDIPLIVDTLTRSNWWAAVGWTLAGSFLFAAAVIIKLLTRFYDREMNRLAAERDELQRKLLEGQGKK
jgi:uncharacterized membrane protein YdcZ (DUF606 family)